MARQSDDTRVLPAGRGDRLLGGAVVAGRYEVRGVLGVGGMGAVYEVFDRHVRERVALKILQAGARADDTLVERFRREVRLARRVTHRNAARVYDLGLEEGRWYLTMELVDGESLQELLERETRLPRERACAIATDVCAGLSAIHAAGVVHRDLKPGNVLLERGGRVVITDFGIARQIERSGDDPLKTQGVIGTPLYMAPEQAAGAQLDARVDVYALGVMLYCMITGQFPGLGFARPGGLAARRRAGPPDPRHVMKVPDGLAELIMACMSLEAGKRPASADALARALQAWVGGERGASAPVTSGATREPVPGVPPRAAAAGTGLNTGSLLRGPTDRALVVLPFRVRGRADDDYLADALAEELSDVLSRTRGLWVIGGGAASSFVERRDPRDIGRELSVDVVVDGTLQRAGARVRITARLYDVRDGCQIWSGRFDGDFADVFELQDRMARQIAEALRVELSTLAYRGATSPEAIEYYLRGRSKAHGFGAQQQAAVALFERSLQLDEDFKPALSALAFATLRCWFFDRKQLRSDWEPRVRSVIQRARDEAPELAETHIASGVYELQRGEYRRGVASLRRALEIAPTCALAHQHLGMIEAEAGRLEQGRERLKLSLELDPSLTVGLYELARLAALTGDAARFERLLSRLISRRHVSRSGATVLEMRVASWSGDLERVRDVAGTVEVDGSAERMIAAAYARMVLGGEDGEAATRELLAMRAKVTNPRFRTLSAQLISEQLVLGGQTRRAVELIDEALSEVLVDLVWLERCPALARLREDPAYPELHARFRRRAREVWS